MFELSIELTRACNYNCKNCGANAGKKLDNELTKQEVFDVITKVKPRTFFILGGEPLLRTDVFEIIDFAKKFGKVGIQTNGSLLTKKAAMKLNADEVHLSIDGLPETDSVLRNPQNFKNVEKALKTLEEAGKLKRVQICITVSKKNLNEIDKIITYFSPRIQKFGIGKLSPVGRADKTLVASRWETLKVYLKLLPLRLKNQITFYSEFGGLLKMVVNYPIILSDGSIIPCCLLRNSVANIRKLKKVPRKKMVCFLFMKGCAECGHVRKFS